MSPMRARAVFQGRRKRNGNEDQRQYKRDERRERDHFAGDRARRERAGGRVGGDCDDTRRAEHQIGAELVDQHAQRYAIPALQSLDHRQADEGGVAQPSHQGQRPDNGVRQAKDLADGPEQRRAEQEEAPGHEYRQQLYGVEVEAVKVVQCQRRQADMDDDAVDRSGGGVGGPTTQP